MTTARSVILVFLVAILIPEAVFAGGSCTANVSPSSVQANSTNNFTFSVTNTGSGTITYIEVQVPSSNFIFGSGSASGWNVSGSSSLKELTGGTLVSGTTLSFSFNVTVGGSEAGAADWHISTNDGTGNANCSGSLGTAISGVADVTAPRIDEVTVTNITSSSATFNWGTDEASDSKVDYGLTEDYGLNKSDSAMITTHTLSLSSLSAGTTYAYSVTSTDASGNISRADQGTITTATATSEGTSTVAASPTPTTAASTTTTTTVTVTGTPTPTPTPKIDRTPPTVVVTTEFPKPFEKAPTIAGKATDDEELKSVEYSTDDGVNWLPVGELEGAGGTQASWAFVPHLTEDGNYSIIVRATDKTGNIGKSESVNLIIDRLPPRVGGALWTVGPFALVPGENGAIVVIEGVAVRVTVSAVGGPTEVVLAVGGHEFDLERSVDTGLWSAEVVLDEAGEYTVEARAVDGAKNETERNLGTIEVLSPGRVKGVKEGQVKLFYQDPQSEVWILWDGRTFGQGNPIKINELGEYRLMAPPGKYYLEIRAPGFKLLRTRIFELDKITPITADWELEAATFFRIGPWKWNWPGWVKPVEIDFESQKRRGSTPNELTGKKAPGFSLPGTLGEATVIDLRGGAAVVSFVNTWSPTSVEQLGVLDELLYNREIDGLVVVPQEGLAKVKVFAKRGNYQSGLLVDADGDWVEKYGLTALPAHFILDRNGVVKLVMVGVFNREELLSVMSKVR